MVEFNTLYNYAPDDRVITEFNTATRKKLEDPIIPIKELGVTVPENDPTGRFKNIVQTVQAAIRRGAGKLQIMLNTNHTQAVGGRPKGMGKEVREALKEVLLANDAEIVGFELPTSLSNLSGIDVQRGVISEEVRQQHLNEVRDAIKFAADTAQGGAIDILSWEFPRTVFDAEWNETGSWKNAFESPDEEKNTQVQFVDARTGSIAGAPVISLPPPPTFEEGKIWNWNEYREYAKKLRKDKKEYEKFVNKIKEIQKEDIEEGVNPRRVLGDDPNYWCYDLLKEAVFSKNIRQAKRQKAMHEVQAKEYFEKAEELKNKMIKKFGSDNPNDWEVKAKQNFKALINFAKQEEIQAREQENIIAENEERMKELQPLIVYAKNKSIKSYADAGIMAMDETHNNKNVKRPISVGPEMGWPHSYGSHPDEFIELIKKSREEMVKRLVEERGYTKEEAEEQARIHLKGTFDTSHLGMWLEKFKPKLPWDKRVKEFNKWYMEQVKRMAKEDIVGGIQIVDSASAAHGHLPPGQGIFPVVEAVKEFKKKGFTGFLVSEGHEEEKFGEGRIMLKTWEAFNSPIGSHYGPLPQRSFQEIHQAYFGRQYAPRQMFGAYTPPRSEYRPWAGGKNPISFE